VLEEPSVRSELDGYLRVAYDAEEGEGKDVAERYNAIAFPTLLVVGRDGREVGRITGDLPARELLAALNKIRTGAESLARLEQLAQKRPDDLKLRLRVGSEWAFRGSRPKACAHLDAVIAGDPQNEHGRAASAMLVKGKYLLLRSLGDNAGAVEVLRALRARFPKSREAEKALYALAVALHRQGKRAEAMQLLESNARTGAEHDDVGWFCLRQRTDYVRGLRHAQRAVALDPGKAMHWANLAELQLRLGQRRQAEASWARARGLDPAYARTRGPLPAQP
jgi:tetratricopeptide (TPR) repeat protein